MCHGSVWAVRHNDQPLPDDHANPNYRTVKVFVGLFVRPILSHQFKQSSTTFQSSEHGGVR